MQELQTYIRENQITLNKRIPDHGKFFTRMNLVVKGIAERVNKEGQGIESLDDAGLLYNNLLRYTRAKFGQGKQWSRGFVNAVVADIKTWAAEQDVEQSDEEE